MASVFIFKAILVLMPFSNMAWKIKYAKDFFPSDNEWAFNYCVQFCMHLVSLLNPDFHHHRMAYNICIQIQDLPGLMVLHALLAWQLRPGAHKTVASKFPLTPSVMFKLGFTNEGGPVPHPCIEFLSLTAK